MNNQSFENPCKGRLICTAKPRGSIHLGELTGIVETWVQLQDHYECIFVISDLDEQETQENLSMSTIQDQYELLADWLAVGISPNNSIITRESDVPGIFQLIELLRDTRDNKSSLWDKSHLSKQELIEAAEILLFKADAVPMTEGQPLQKIKAAQQMGITFNQNYGELFPIIQPHKIQSEELPGLDGHPMQRSLENMILLKELDEETERKIDRSAVNALVMYAVRFDPDQDRAKATIDDFYAKRLQEADLRKHVAVLLGDYLHSARVKRDKWIANPDDLEAILNLGSRRARAVAMETLSEIETRIQRAII